MAKRASRNLAEAELVRRTVDGILEQVKAETHHMLLLSGVNAAPIGGRWGYSNRNLAVQQADLTNLEWVTAAGLTEVADEPLQATWRPNLMQKRAVLDRAFVCIRDAPLARLKVYWVEPSILFDHAALLINLPYSEAGMGFAGACLPLMQKKQQGLKINLNNGTIRNVGKSGPGSSKTALKQTRPRICFRTRIYSGRSRRQSFLQNQ